MWVEATGYLKLMNGVPEKCVPAIFTAEEGAPVVSRLPM